MKFDKYNISSDIKNNLRRLGFITPTDIQYKSIPSIMDGEDVLAVAQTGTGKTAAFAIPIINTIHMNKPSKRSRGVQCIVMVPTRELAMQVGGVFNKLAKHTKVKAFALYGGVQQDRQINKLQEGIDILITTPGRMFDLINQKYIKLDYVDMFVLDEADHMLELGFIEDIKYIKKMLTRRHQTLFFSATIDEKIKKVAYSQVKSSAIRIQISPKDPVSKNVSHFVMHVEMDDKRFFLEKFIKENPTSKILVFVRTKVRAERVAKAMARVGIESYTIHSGKEQEERDDAMRKFKKSHCKLMVATDISARGIDVPNINYVINYDLPIKTTSYVHRVGRTGRGVNKGTAISFCSNEELELLDEIQGFLNKKITIIKISKTDYSTAVAEAKEPAHWETLIKENDLLDVKKKKRRNQKLVAKNRNKIKQKKAIKKK